MRLLVTVILAVLLASALHAQPLSIRHLAGPNDGGGPALIDGPAATSRVEQPYDLARSGTTLFIADLNAVRRLANGVVTTWSTVSADSIAVAPDGQLYGVVGNEIVRIPQGTSAVPIHAADHWITSLTFSADGTLYFLEGHAVMRMPVGGTATLFAGSINEAGMAEGTGPAARFTLPVDLTFGGNGVLYVAEQCRIRAVSQNAVVTTATSTQCLHWMDPEAQTGFTTITSLGRAADGTILAGDHLTRGVRRIDFNGNVTPVFNSNVDFGPVTPGPSGVGRMVHVAAVEGGANGEVFVSDVDPVIHVISGGSISTLVGKAVPFGWQDGAGAAARFSEYSLSSPVALNGETIFADGKNGIRAVNAAGQVRTIVPGGGVTGDPTRARNVYSVAAASDGSIFFMDDAQLRKRSPDGRITDIAGGPQPGAADGIGAAARFWSNAYGLLVQPDGSVLVADSSNAAIRHVTPDGVVTTWAGKLNERGTAEGPRLDARFHYPIAMTTGPSGTVYIAEPVSIRALDPDGRVRMVAPTQGYATSLAFDAATNELYIGVGSAVRKLSGNTTTTVAGNLYTSGNAAGAGSHARFGLVSGVSVQRIDGELQVVITDASNRNIRLGTLARRRAVN